MGLETVCTVLYEGESYEPKVLLETEAVVFRGALKKTIPFREMTAITAEDDLLSFVHNGVPVEVRVGPKASVWAERILHPKSLLDKLGIKAGDHVAIVNVDDVEFREQLCGRTSNVIEGAPDGYVPCVFLQVDQAEELETLSRLRECIHPTGAFWVIHPKGRTDLKDLHVFAAAKAAGLVDVKVVAFSKTHSALKLVIPKAQRH